MGELGGWSGKDTIKRFEAFGYRVVRQRGSHVRLEHLETKRAITVPLHKELKIGLLRALLQETGVSIEEFVGTR